jgi:hypothetical protein
MPEQTKAGDSPISETLSQDFCALDSPKETRFELFVYPADETSRLSNVLPGLVALGWLFEEVRGRTSLGLEVWASLPRYHKVDMDGLACPIHLCSRFRLLLAERSVDESMAVVRQQDSTIS